MPTGIAQHTLPHTRPIPPRRMRRSRGAKYKGWWAHGVDKIEHVVWQKSRVFLDLRDDVPPAQFALPHDLHTHPTPF